MTHRTPPQNPLALTAAQDDAARLVDSDDVLERWLRSLIARGEPRLSARVAVAAARMALPVWEARGPGSRAPHERVHAAQAWVECPCEIHADAAGRLAFANGDDNPLKGWRAIRIRGLEVDDWAATSAHWSADHAASSAWALQRGVSAADAAIAASFLSLTACAEADGDRAAARHVLVRALMAELAVHVTDWSLDAAQVRPPPVSVERPKVSELPKPAAEPPIRRRRFRLQPRLEEFERALLEIAGQLAPSRTPVPPRLEYRESRSEYRTELEHRWTGDELTATLTWLSESAPFNGTDREWSAVIESGTKRLEARLLEGPLTRASFSGDEGLARRLADALEAACLDEE